MHQLILMQCAATLAVAVGAGCIGGTQAAVSALLGGGACVIPNALFAMRLAFAARRAGLDADPAVGAGRQVSAFFVGEFMKVGLTVAFLALIARAVPNVVWLAVIVAIVAVLKTPLLLAFITPRQAPP